LAHSLFNMLSLSLFTIFVWYLAQIGIVSAATIPSGAITVGSGGKYSTLAAALKDTSRQVLYRVYYDESNLDFIATYIISMPEPIPVKSPSVVPTLKSTARRRTPLATLVTRLH
jgi:hypothetical protein